MYCFCIFDLFNAILTRLNAIMHLYISHIRFTFDCSNSFILMIFTYFHPCLILFFFFCMSSCSCLLHMDVIPRGSFSCHHFSVSCLFQLSYLVCGAFAVCSVPVFLSSSLSTTHAFLMFMLHFDISICFILCNTRLALFYVFCYCQQIL